MKVEVPFGSKNTVKFHVPDENFYGILQPKAVKSEQNAEAAILYAINHPIGCPTLERIISSDQRVCIICDDISRPTPCHLILPVIVKKLSEIGVKDSNIKIIMALGSHRYMSESEMKMKVGIKIYERFQVKNSEFKKEDELIELSTSTDGVNVFVTKEAMDCDIRIGVGNVVPHPLMGWSGGGKILFPGITGESTVAKFHMMGGMSDENLFGREDCNIRLNMEKLVDLIGLHFIVNTVLTSNHDIYKVFAGHYIDAHRECVKYAKVAFGCQMKKKVDIIVVSSYPADEDFWQSTKGYCSAELGLKDETSSIVLVSPNFEGIGPHPEYLKFFGMDNAEKILARMFNGESIEGDPLAIAVGTSMSKLRRRKNLLLVTDGITSEEAQICKIPCYPLEELQQVVDRTIAMYQDPTVAVLTHGGELCITL